MVGVAVALALAFEDPVVAKVFVLESATPAAVLPLALTIEYTDGTTEGITAPEYLSTAIFTTTVASVVALTVLVTVLQSSALF